MSKRTDRYYPDKVPDNRTSAQRDRDRILYTSAFRRLARVTQVVSAEEGHVFHNRLTHSLQVAQVGSRIAQKLIRDASEASGPLQDVDPDVVEAACLAHDLGHPPFGHIAEQELDKLATSHGLPDGFEGNAQSFRIVTSLASASSTGPGLNLTRATLNGVLKYPWARRENPKKIDKWGAYESERDQFLWARELVVERGREQEPSAEAMLMDVADDITYSVHDVDDFYRAGLIPIDRLRVDPGERQRFYREVFERVSGTLPADLNESYLEQSFEKLILKIPQDKPYEGTMRDRGLLRDLTASLIGDFVRSVGIERAGGGVSKLTQPKQRRAEIFMLKQLTWHYVIKNPALASQQQGQRTIIRTLFNVFHKAALDEKDGNVDVFPVGMRETLRGIIESKGDAAPRETTRAIIDFISSLTEEQAVDACHRLTGVSLGSALVERWK